MTHLILFPTHFGLVHEGAETAHSGFVHEGAETAHSGLVHNNNNNNNNVHLSCAHQRPERSHDTY